MAPAPDLSKEERRVMTHALGDLRRDRRRKARNLDECYRNRYAAAGDSIVTWDGLAARGLAAQYEGSVGPYPTYYVTEAGYVALTSRPPGPPPTAHTPAPQPTAYPPPAILYRDLQGDGSEDVAASAAAAGWGGLVTANRTAFPRGRVDEPEQCALIVGRYSVLPFYKETADDLALLGYRLANSYDQHDFCADIKRWYAVLSEFTPKTYTEGWDRLPEGSYVLKGSTNSRKHKWATHMFAPTKADVPAVFGRLLGDSLIAPQGIVAREYVPLRQLGTGINGMPFTHEYRLFYWGDRFVAGGFYWSSFEDAEQFCEVPAAARALGDKLAEIVAAGDMSGYPEHYTHLCHVCNGARDEISRCIDCGRTPYDVPPPYARFFVLDVAETAAGDWILIEVNDGQMSGLSEIDPVEFYRSLWATVSASESAP